MKENKKYPLFKAELQLLYRRLLRRYGQQGWWPLLELHGKKGCNPTKAGSIEGYHPGDYSYPKDDKQCFEICLGAILTQNTSWLNVEKALLNLKEKDALSPEAILELDEKMLADIIRPSGYYNQKAKKIRIFSEFFLSLDGGMPSREQLLGLWGIGMETADSILLYAYRQPVFVVDAYTRRFLVKNRIIKGQEKYETIRNILEDNISRDYRIYQEYHALIVQDEKR